MKHITVSGACPTPLPPPPPPPGTNPPPTSGPPNSSPGATADIYIYAEHIHFSDENPDPGETITLFAYINYIGTDPVINLPVSLNDLYPVGGVLRRFPIDSALVSFPDGQNSSPVAISIPWTNTAAGAHIIQAVTEPPFTQFTGNDKATRFIFVGDPPLLQISKSASLLVDVNGDGAISPGDTIHYTISYTNQGSSEVTGAVISDDYDETLLQTPAPISDGGTAAAGVITWNLGTLAAGATGSVTYEVAVIPETEFPSGTTVIRNYALLSTDQAPAVAASHEIEVTPNQAPTADDQSVTTDEDRPKEITLTAADPDNDTLTYSLLTYPAHGSLDGTPPDLTYTPNPDFNGSGSFTFKVNDGLVGSNEATVTITVNPVNDAPQAANDEVTTPEDTLVTFSVADNDTDIDDNLDPGSAILLSQPAHGSLTNHGAGSFDYLPFSNFFGSDSFTYQICDTDGVCDDATVSITITPVNDAPVCTGAVPSRSTIWPPNNQFEPITVTGMTDVEADPITIIINTIFQDEPIGSTPDGQGIGSDTAQVRAERAGNGNGRYYHIGFTASDGQGGICSGVVRVSVPKSQGNNGRAIDNGPLYDSTIPG